MDVGNLISGSSAFFKSNLNIWKFTVHVLLKPGLENFEHYFPSMWDECNCAVIWTFFGIAFLWNWNENWPFPVLWPLLSFPNLLAYWVQHFHSIIFILPKFLWWKAVSSVYITRACHVHSRRLTVTGFHWIFDNSSRLCQTVLLLSLRLKKDKIDTSLGFYSFTYS